MDATATSAPSPSLSPSLSLSAAIPGPPEMNSLDWWNDYFAKHWSANNGSAQTAHFMARLISGLPDPERMHFNEPGREILDWGCAFGEGTSLLARVFPLARVCGLDFSENAIDEARKRHPGVEYLQSRQGIPREFDVIVTSNCLEHFDDPFGVAGEHAEFCRDLYIALVPYDEKDLCPYHKVRFVESSFPATIGGRMTLIETRLVEVDKPYWDGKQILAVYGSPRYVAKRSRMASLSPTIQERIEAERAKWNDYYASIDQASETPAVAAFNAELCGLIGGLLPAGGRILEAGCGAGLQSLAVARDPRFQTALLDFSDRAIGHAQRRFAEEGLSARFEIGDVFQHGAAEYDLVFNAGVLEHYSLAEQTAFLRGMASRSKNYVLVLVPNRLCYWYWIWRIHAAHRSSWPFGKESPLCDLAESFENAGLEFVGQTFLGADWAEDFIAYTPGLAADLRSILTEAHRTAIIPNASKCYLLAALGRVPDAPRPAPDAAKTIESRWPRSDIREPIATAEVLAALGDALALKIAADAKVIDRDAELARQRSARLIRDLEFNERLAEIERLNAELQRLERESQRRAAELERELQRERDARQAVVPLIETARALTDDASPHAWPNAEQAQDWSQTLEQRGDDLQRLRQDLQVILASRSWRASRAMQKLRRTLLPPGALREKAARTVWRSARRIWRRDRTA